MTRAVLAAIAVAALFPAAASAQQVSRNDEPVWGPRVRVTPFVGQAPTVSRTERWMVSAGGTPAGLRVDVDLAAGTAAGAVIEVRAVERFGFVASGTYITRGRTREFSPTAGDVFDHPGSDFLIAKAGVAMRLRESISELQFRRLSASVFAAPAYIREMPKDDPFSPAAFLKAISHWAANFGIEAEMPLGWQSVSIQAGVEDYMVWWNDKEAARRVDLVNATEHDFHTSTVINTDRSHMLLFRAGLSFRFR